MRSRVSSLVTAAAVLLAGGLFAPAALAVDMGTISSGETRTATIPLGATHERTIAATAGERVIIKSVNHALQGMNIEVLDAGLNVVAQNTGCQPLEFTFGAEASYTVKTYNGCNPGYAGAYSITLVNVDGGPLTAAGDPNGGPLASGQTVTGSLPHSDLDVYQFHAEPGDRVRVKAAFAAGTPGITILGPSSFRKDYCNPMGRLSETVLTESGLHLLILKDCGTQLADYDLTLQLIPGAFSHPGDLDGGNFLAVPGSVSGRIDSSSDLDAFHFYAAAGEVMNLGLVGWTSPLDPAFSLYLPDGSVDTSGCAFGTYTCTVPTAAPGLYTVVVEDYGSNGTYGISGTYQLSVTSNLQPPPNPGLYNPQPPVDGAVLFNAFGSLSWEPVAGATGYTVYFGDDVLQPLPFEAATADPALPIPYHKMYAGRTYYWRVVAATPAGQIEGPYWWFTFDCTASVAITPAALDFGNICVNTTSAARTITIANTGTCSLDPRVASVPAGFTVVSDDCTGAPAGGHLAASESCSIQVAFSPTSECAYAGGLALEGLLPGLHSGVVPLAGAGATADLRISAVSDPAPAPIGGLTVSVTDTAENVGLATVPPSAVGYFFSLDRVITPADAPAPSASRAIPQLDGGASSTGTVSITIPSDLPDGSYYLGACVDGEQLVPESDETNNCLASASAVVVRRDLTVAELTNPTQPDPATWTYTFTETTRNIGNMALANSATGYRLSLDQKISRLDPVYTSTRAIPLLAPDPDPGHFSTANLTLSLSSITPPGTYFVAACADDTRLYAESDETNNCRISKTTIRVQPDLVVTGVSNPPLQGSAGTTFSVTDTTRNAGLTEAPPSATQYRLSLDTSVTATDPQLTGTRAVPTIGRTVDSTGAVAVTIPASVPQGTFYLAACADGQKQVAETDEANNCVVSATTITIKRADLVVSSVSNPPAAGAAGNSFSVTDTTRNDGEAATGAATTNYRLSLDATITASDPLLTGTRAVPALGALGELSSGSATVTLPATIAPGSYYLGACADASSAVPETDETNNCRASATKIQVDSPDLRVTALSDPPAGGMVGSSFTVDETTANASPGVAAVASTTRYRFSLDTTITTSDPALTGSRSVPALGAGASSAGSATVTIPPAIAPGIYYLAACADDPKVVAETDENNNCRLSATTIDLQKADLVVTLVSDPPASGLIGDSFTVDDTVANNGAVEAGASATRYRLSADATITAADPLLTGSRAVGAVSTGAASAGTGTVVTIPATAPHGTFYLGACADDANAVSESSEGNNCRASAGRIVISKPDLVVTLVGEPPIEGDLEQTFEVRDITKNVGPVPAGASTTRYRLSLDTTITTSDPLLTGTRAVPSLGAADPENTSDGTVTVTIPKNIAQGSYYLAACADAGSAVAESSESNNCAVSTGTLDVLNADLRVTSLSPPPAVGLVGTSFSVSDTTANSGVATAAASTTRYRLSLDPNVTTSDPLLTGSRPVPAVASGEVSYGTVTVTIPATVPQGTYYLGACADDLSVVTESNETNNCRVAATTIDLQKPDLAVAAISDPPAGGTVGASFSVDDTTANLSATAPAGASTTRYRLSLDTTITAADPLLTGTRAVLSLGAAESSAGTAVVTIPGTIAQGVYYLAACADDASAVSESDETNNCRVSAATISLQKADLTVTAVTDPPAGGTVGASFDVTDTTANGGAVAAGASTTRYRLSLDTTITAADPLLTGTRAVLSLGAGASSTGTVTLTLPAAIAQGTYYLAACADDAGAVSESSETNNCRVSTTTISLQKADLTVTAITDPPAEGTVGMSFTVDDTTRNGGVAAAGASSTRYRFSLDAAITAADPLLTGSRSVSALNAGDSSNGVGTVVTVPGTLAEGTYYLAACADDASAVSESNETNNCLVAAHTINLRKPDLVVTLVSDPPASGTGGTSFTVADTTANHGGAAAGASTTRYRLSLDAAITPADPLLTGSREVPALAPDGLSAGAGTTVTIPATVAQGTYYLAACADAASAVAESVETNNCLVSANTIDLQKADLTITAVSDPPAEGGVGSVITVTDTTTNAGAAAAGASTTRFRLSTDSTITSADTLITEFTVKHTAPPLGVGEASTATILLVLPAVAQGNYYLGACADEGNLVSESDETNNCLASATQIWMKKPDLTVTAVGDPPADGYVGTNFSVSDTTTNSGIASALSSTTRYRLSSDATITSADPLLTGTRAVSALNPGASSAGTATVSIPASVAHGTYYFAACADAASAISESDETNNCLVAAATITLRKPDLVITAVSDPPAGGTVGTSFSVTDTTANAGAVAAAASTTRYRLSLDATITSADTLLTGTRAVPALGGAEDSTGAATVTIPASIAEGTYYLAACADAASVVAETDETNNCLLAAATIDLRKADLTVTAVTEPPADGTVGASFEVGDTTANAGAAPAEASSTRYRLSADTTITTADTLLTGARAVPALGVGAASSGTVTVTIPGTIPPGSFYLAACADSGSGVSESNEANNCLVSATRIQVRKPDLRVSHVSEPPADGVAGDAFAVSDTTLNDAGALDAAGASTTRYRLSADLTITSSDPLLTGSRSVGPLAIGEESSGAASVTIPAAVPQGTYYLAACADDTNTVSESSEANNCLPSAGRIRVWRSDLTILALSEPPAEGAAGGSFTVTETTTNSGLAAAAASTTRYRLSLDTTITSADPLLTGTRGVPALGIGASSGGSVVVAIPASIAEGHYYLAACADYASAVAESDETNNCRASATTINLWKPDLSYTLQTAVPAELVLGQTLALTGTVTNSAANGVAGASTTRFRLSTDTTITASDPLLQGELSSPRLDPGGSDVGSAVLTVPGDLATGAYYLAGCADDLLQVPEQDEADNCSLWPSPVNVRGADLLISSLGDPPAVLSPGESFTVGDTVTNSGPGAAASSLTIYRLSLDAVLDPLDRTLFGERWVPAIGPSGASSTGTATLTIPGTVMPGIYHLIACADTGDAVNEENEANNCRTAAGTVTIQPGQPDLEVAALSEPPAAVDAGMYFLVTDTTANTSPSMGTGGSSRTRYYLSLDGTLGAEDHLLSGFPDYRFVPALAALADSTGDQWPVVPASVPGGAYYLVACADDYDDVVEGDETNNCRFSAGTMTVRNPDLVATHDGCESFTSPGDFFPVNVTVTNQSAARVGPSTTRFVLSTDAVIDAGDLLLTGTMEVDVLLPGASANELVVVDVPIDVPAGTYYIAACADYPNAIFEPNEVNNCSICGTPTVVSLADLEITGVSGFPAAANLDLPFSVTDTTASTGPGETVTFRNAYYLSTDTVIGAGDTLLDGSRTILQTMIPYSTNTGTTTLTIPPYAATGFYYVGVCADSENAVPESDESDNCRASATRIEIRPPMPDLVVSAVSAPPASAHSHAEFSITDTTRNTSGLVGAAATTTSYYLSADFALDAGDHLLPGSRAVPALSPGASDSATVTVSIPREVPGGAYWLLACADRLNQVMESSESNNCAVSATHVQLSSLPDLVETLDLVGLPPYLFPGQSFTMWNQVENEGNATASSSTTRFRLSLDTTITSADPLLTGTQSVPSLVSGSFVRSGANLTVPAIPEGEYYYAACVDDYQWVPESNESNNCQAVGYTVNLRWAALSVSALSSPGVVTRGTAFSVTDTTANSALFGGDASGFTNNYRLSTDATIDGSDPTLSGTRAVPALGAGAENSGSANVIVPGVVMPGFYYLGICADAANAVPETNEADNCRATATMIEVR